MVTLSMVPLHVNGNLEMLKENAQGMTLSTKNKMDHTKIHVTSFNFFPRCRLYFPQIDQIFNPTCPSRTLSCPHQELGSVSLNLVGPLYPLWLTEYRRSDSVTMLRLGEKRWCTFHLSLCWDTYLWNPGSTYEKSSHWKAAMPERFYKETTCRERCWTTYSCLSSQLLKSPSADSRHVR